MNSQVEAATEGSMNMTDAQYDALYKKAEEVINKKYVNLTTEAEKTMLFKQVTKLFVENSGGMTLLAIIMSLESS